MSRPISFVLALLVAAAVALAVATPRLLTGPAADPGSDPGTPAPATTAEPDRAYPAPPGGGSPMAMPTADAEGGAVPSARPSPELVEHAAVTPAGIDTLHLPPLPADLVYLRDGIVFRWSAAGGALHAIVSPPDMPADKSSRRPTDPLGPTWTFVLSRDGSTLVYPLRYDVTTADGAGHTETELIVLDVRHAEERVRLRLRGELVGDGYPARDLAVAPDGGWAMIAAPAAGGADGRGSAVYRLELVRDAAPVEIAACVGGCSAIVLDEGGERASFGDEEGIKVVDVVPGSTPRLLRAHVPEERRYEPVSFSPDGSALLASVGLTEGSTMAALDTATGAETRLDVFAYICCRADLSWTTGTGRAILRATRGSLHVDIPGGGGRPDSTLVLVDVGPADPGGVTTRAVASPLDLGDGFVAILLRSIAGEAGPSSGLWELDTSANAWWRLVALPDIETPVDPEDDAQASNDVAQLAGEVIWGPGGAFAFRGGSHAVVGRRDPPEAWDASAILAGDQADGTPVQAVAWGAEAE